MTQTVAPPQSQKEEVRFAVVLNGGVSLAVWMGGVVREIDAVTEGFGGVADECDAGVFIPQVAWEE